MQEYIWFLAKTNAEAVNSNECWNPLSNGLSEFQQTLKSKTLRYKTTGSILISKKIVSGSYK